MHSNWLLGTSYTTISAQRSYCTLKLVYDIASCYTLQGHKEQKNVSGAINF